MLGRDLIAQAQSGKSHLPLSTALSLSPRSCPQLRPHLSFVRAAAARG
jgi:hypothetical protein